MFSIHSYSNCVKEDTVSKQRENDEVNRGEHAAANPSLRLDPMVHDSVPVLTCENLKKTNGSERNENLFSVLN